MSQDSDFFALALKVFKTSCYVALEWPVDNPTFKQYVVEDVFTIETATATYFSNLLASPGLSAFQHPNKFVDASVAVRRQELSGGNMVTEGTIDVYHVGNAGIADLSDLLRFVTNKNTTGTNDFLVLDSLIGMNVEVSMVSFSNSQKSEALAGGFENFYLDSTQAGQKYSDSEKTLIAVTSILSFALFALSVILIWVAGGWLALRHQVQVLLHREEERTRMSLMAIEHKPTQDTEEDNSPRKDDATEFTNPSGILGGNPYYGKSANTFAGLGVKMTPTRKPKSDVESEIGTPMSEYSDSGRMPIGIQSMRKLLANPAADDDFALGAYGMKRLNYGDE